MISIVAIGASQGGVKGLRTLLSNFPADFGPPILVVIHTGPQPSILPSLLNDVSRLPASHAKEGERIEGGHIYVAPPDHHLLVRNGHARLSRGPRVNWTRPAIDPLFRSVAMEYGPGAIGVILTGNLSDGTVGLYEIKNRGGIGIVQDPREAEAPSMPRSALENAAPDYCVPLSGMAELLARLVAQSSLEEADIRGVRVMDDVEQPMQRPVAQTCPECGGAMREETVGSITQFRCHIGHVLNAEVMVAAQLDLLERDLSSALRMLNERAELCRDLAEKHAARGDLHGRGMWMRAADEAREREHAIEKMTEAEWIRPESMIAAS